MTRVPTQYHTSVGSGLTPKHTTGRITGSRPHGPDLRSMGDWSTHWNCSVRHWRTETESKEWALDPLDVTGDPSNTLYLLTLCVFRSGLGRVLYFREQLRLHLPLQRVNTFSNTFTRGP